MISRTLVWVLIVIVGFSQEVAADIYTPVSVNLTVDEFNTVLNRYFESGFKLEDSLDEIPKINGLDAKFSSVKYKANIKPKFELDQNSKIKIYSKIDFAQFEINRLDLKYKTTRKVGSTTINIKTEIKCDYLKIYMQDGIEYNVEGVLEKNKPKITKSDLPDNLDFKIDSSNCTGPKDFETFLPEIALKWLATRDGNIETLKFINQEIIDAFWINLKKGIEIDIFGRKIYLALLNFIQDGKDFKVNLMVRWPKNDQFYLNLKDPDSEGSLTMKSMDFDRVLNQWIKGGCFEFTFLRSDMPAVDKLFNNRLYQFFIWNDLTNFSKSANFNLKVKLCLEDIKLESDLYHGLRFKHKSSVIVQMNFLGTENKELPYVFLWSKVEGYIDIVTNENGMALRLQKSTFDFKYSYHPKMSEWRKSKPSGGPAIKTIMGYVLPAIEELKTVMLPNFKEVFENKKVIYNQNSNLYFKD